MNDGLVRVDTVTVPTSVPPPRPERPTERSLRWDLVGIGLAVLFAVIAVAVIDTGSFAEWLAENRDAKVDEVIVITFVLVCVAGLVAIRRWLGTSYRLIRFEESHEPAHLADATQVQRSFRRDLIALSTALLVAVILLPIIDTGSLASWLEHQSHTKVDEAIVVTFLLMVGLTFFSIRRWLDLTRQLVRADALYRATAQLNREKTILGELGDLLQSCRSTEEAQRLITDRASLLFPGSSGAVCVTNYSRNLVDVVATWGRPPFADAFFAPDDCWALRRGRPYAVAGDASVACAHVATPRPLRSLCVPMMAHGETLGLLYLCMPAGSDAPADWSESEERLAKTVSEQAALALANLPLRETLRRQSIRDPLTGIYNRRYLEETLDRELQRAARRRAPLAVLMLDVDDFKSLNDTLGHDAGDLVLRALADVLTSAFRGEDVVCRYGGEEFAVVMPDTTREAARERAEEARGVMEKMVVKVKGPVPAHATISAGIAMFPDDGSGGSALFHAADGALYRAKAGGKNQVVLA